MTAELVLDDDGNRIYPKLQLSRPPANPEELWWLVKALWNVEIPRVKVCPDHVAPFDAFAEGYFGNENNFCLWYGSRGTGKSYMLALLAVTKSLVQETNTVLLGGSMAQAANVQEHIENMLLTPGAPTWAVLRQIQTEITFTGGNWIRPLPASQKTVRGPHPSNTLLDEIDEMDEKVYDAAMGQAMAKPNARGIVIPEMVVASSTWQNPVGNFSRVLGMCRDKGLPVRTWCFQEVLKTATNPSGWMDPAFIERKRASVPAEMFRVEYELGEPAGGSRAFDLVLLNKAFTQMDTASQRHSSDDDEWVFEEPQATGWYAIGADWAKERDKTVIVVARVDEKPWRIVYLRAVNRKPYPEMAAMFNDALMKYQAVAAHDGTGIGNVINDYIDERAHKVLMVGRGRTELLVDYINAVEKGVYRLPANTPAFDAHKGTTVDEVYAPGKWNSHLSDFVAAFSIMHNAATKQAPAAAGEGVNRSAYVSRSHRDLTYGPTEQVVSVSGDVRVVQVDDNPYVIR